MNRRKPVCVRIGEEEFKAGLLTCGISWKLATEVRTIQDAMMKSVRGEPFTPELEAAYIPAAVAVVSACLSAHHPECNEEWIRTNVLDHELGAIIGAIWAASLPPNKGGSGGPEAKSP